MIPIIMITHDRKPAYLEPTLKALFGTEPGIEKVHVLVHEPEINLDISHILQDFEKVEARALSAEEHAEKMALGRRTRVCHAMRLALEMVDGECIFLEDDANFAMSWLTTLERHFERDATLHRERMFVSLCSPFKHQLREGFVRWNPGNFQGTVALYLGSEARLAAIEALQVAESKVWPAPGIGSDVALRDWLLTDKSKGIELFTIYPSLVRHMGVVSSIEAPAVRQRQAERAERGAKPGRVPVTFPEKQFRPSQATPNVVRTDADATPAKPRKTDKPPVSWRNKL